ncbi:hypothetical protein O6H91_01G005700 [Diphasiastrum complanatum]|nr:hypothetical protein O6H91_01G005700 [Diphasiastrum complanatum]
MVAVGLSTVSIGGLNLELVRKGVQQMRVLCIGLGGGSLPLFLAQNLPGAIVEAVEIDDVVISAATEAMGFPASCLTRNRQTSKLAGTKASSMKAFLHAEELYLKQKPVHIASDVQNVQAVDTVEQHCHQILVDKMEMGEVEEALWGDVAERLFVHEADGEEFLLKASQISKLGAEAALCYDLVFVDAYDGNDEIPCQLMEKNGTFLNALSLLLNPTHGTVVVNLHTDAPPPSLLERITGAFSPGFDPSLPHGRAVQATCLTYRDALLGASKTESMFVKNTYARSTLIIDNMPHDVLRGGIALTIAVPWQQNICLTVSKTRMQKIATLNHDEKVVRSGADVARKLLLKGLLGEAKTIQNLLCTSMDLPQRVSRGFRLVH